MAKGTEVQKVAGSTSKCGRYMEEKNTHLNWGGLYDMLCIVINVSLLSNLYWKIKLNVQKSVRVVVSKKSMKIDGEKDSTVLIRQMSLT